VIHRAPNLTKPGIGLEMKGFELSSPVGKIACYTRRSGAPINILFSKEWRETRCSVVAGGGGLSCGF